MRFESVHHYAQLFAAMLFVADCMGLNTTSFTSLTATPTSKPRLSTQADPPFGTPVAGDYGGRFRPQVHFSAPKQFMSDPNGLFRDENDTWHLYYQYNPRDLKFGRPHWGHATSQDLYHWENQAVALSPPNDDIGLFSGSIVMDKNNTSGLFPNQTNGVVAIYVGFLSFPVPLIFVCADYEKTLSETLSDGSAGPQTQALAYSRDGGYTFTPFKHNPVIDSEARHFRDPKVVLFQDRWILLVAYSQEFNMGIFSSPNLINWTHESNFSLHGLIGSQWECPNLVHLPYIDEKGQKQNESVWTLFMSIDPGAPLGGSAVQYYPGTFNGTHFKATDSVARTVDSAKDYYAMQFFNGLPKDEAVSMAWASNWQYASEAPTDLEKWRGTMSLPRRHYMTKTEDVGLKLVSWPYNLQHVMGETIASKNSVSKKTIAIDFSEVDSNAIYWEINATGIPGKETIGEPVSLNFTLINPSTLEYVRGGYYFGARHLIDFGGDTPLFLDRGGARGFDNVFFTDKFFVSSAHYHNTWSLSGVLDRSIMEVFLNRGLDTATTLYFTSQPLTVMLLSVSDLPEGMRVSIHVNGLKSAWNDMKSSDGLVHGNQTVEVRGH
ncbi:invertase precursor [Moelleriella libera RCEF 2490]|uniref:Invertase n=1 Tax=Moelleriella libera RCEF 2490 TaxID=1081109 RepID=A0A168EGN7_9HYPO|nr:invertase precursor [Moelleriella libera RCEF 2490]